MNDESQFIKILDIEEKHNILQVQPHSEYKEQQMPRKVEDKTPNRPIENVENNREKEIEDRELGSIGDAYRTIFENYAVAITLVDEQERIISWNKYTEELLGMNENDLYMVPVSTLYPPEEWQRMREENIRQKGIKYRMETKMIRKDNRIFNVEISLCVLKSEKGKTVGSVGVIKDITKQKELERALEKSEKKFKQLYEKAPVPYHTLLPSGVITDVNEIWCQVLGYSKDEVVGKIIFDFVHEAERDVAKASFEKKLQSKVMYSQASERAFITKTGEKRLFVIRDFFLFDEDNNLTAVYTLMNDVTNLKKIEEELNKYQEHLKKLVEERTSDLEIINTQLQQEIYVRKKGEETLRESQEKYKRLFESSPELIAEIDEGGIFLAVNPTMAGSIGVPAEKLIGKNIFNEMPKEIIEERAKIARTALNDGKIQIAEDERAGRFFYNIYVPLFYPDGRKTIQLIARDITVQKKAEKALKESEEKIRKIIDSSPDNITVSDLNGNIIDCNQATVDMHGFSTKEDIIGKNALEFIAPKDHEKAIENLKKILEVGPVKNAEYVFLKKDGSEFPAEISASVIRDSSGKPMSFMGVIKDISERKKTEQLLKESEEKFRTIFDNSTEGILLADMENKKFFTGNETICTMLGYTTEEIKNLGVMEIYPKEDLPFVVEQFEKQARKEIVFAKNIPMKRKNGSVFYADINSVPMVLAGKTYLMGSFRNITERKEAEDALKESEGKLRSIVENSSDQIFMVDKDCKYLSINKIAADLCRKSPQEMIGVSIFEIFPENIAVQFSKNIKNVFDTCKSMFIEEKMVMQGRELYYSTALNPVQDGSGRVIAVTGIVRDITKDKEAEEEIRYLKDYNENILESNPNPMMVVKGKQIEYINKSFISIFGKTKDEFIKRNLKDVIPLEIFPVFENLSQETGISKELKFRGKEYTVSFFVIKKTAAAAEEEEEEEEEDVRKGIVFQDITERKQAEKEREKILQWQQGVNTLQQSLLAPAPLEDKLKTITDSIVRFFDADFCRIWLTQPGDLCEQGCTHAEVHEGPHICRYRDRCLRLRASSGRYTHTDGKTYGRVPFGCYKIGCVASGEDHKFLTNDVQNDPRVHNNDWARELGLVSFAGYQLRVPGGQTIGVVALFAKHLITPAEDTILDGISNAVARVVQQSIADEKVRESTKKIELQNIQLKKLDKIKSDFLNITSHELRTPMSAIKGYTQMVFKQKLGQITEEQQQALTVVLRNTDRLDNLIRDILDISRLESGTMKFVPEKTNHGKMVEEAIETMQPTAELKKIKINTEIENDIPEMMVDPERIKQVIINIVNNAIKFSPNGTTINVRTKKENDKILFEIQDFGRGIPKDKQEKIFEIFYQVDSGMDRKFGGAGLGLAISRGIILSHGGNIWVESEPDKGSTFRFTLPITPVQDLEGKFRDVDIFKLKDSKRAMENDLRDKTVVWDEPGEKRGEKT